MFSCPFVPQITKFLAPFPLDDGSAKASFLYGTLFLVFSAVLMSTTMNFGDPIACLIPRNYSVEERQYAKSLCLRGNTYFWPVVRDGPNGWLKQPFTDEDKQANSTDYYAYISTIFAVLALLSFAPKLVFEVMLKTTRVPLKRLATEALEAQEESREMRAEKVNEMADLFHEDIVTRKTFECWNIWKVNLISKALYLFSTLLQFCMLSSFLHFEDDLLWGWTLTYNKWIGRTWEETGVFARIVFCDVEMASIEGVRKLDTVQCHLGVMNINEQLCMLLWWWYCILAVVTLVGFLVELMNCVRASTMKREEELQEFAEFLTPDGLFVLRFLQKISHRVTNEMTVKLWEKYESDRQDRHLE